MIRRSRTALAHSLALLSLALSAAAAAAPRPHPQRQVLPDGVTPRHYDLALSPHADELTFSGKVAITVEVAAATDSVTLNAVGLSFDRVSIDGGPQARVSLDAALERARLSFAAPIDPGQHVLSIDYHGAIGRSTLGFFAMDYSGTDGPRRTLVTNLEPTAARLLLPCWDEPARKATFTLTVDVPADRMAVSNMPVAQITPLSPTLQRVRFAESPRMSTYLLFVGIGDFERVLRKVDGVDVGVVVKRGDAAKGAYALDQAVTLLHYYNQYFGIPYPLPKLDLIAAPGEIEGEAMENWGAILYAQDELLFDPSSSTERDRQQVFATVAHEMAHQWFGDLVTMAWWDDLWLNEGFASWMQTYAADELHPEWQTGLKAAERSERGKNADALPSTHAVVQPVDTPAQALQSFDAITYNKGAAVITMINAYVGRERFRDGVRHYLRAHAFGNTVDTDLWRPMQQAVGRPIIGIAHDFTRQAGLPLVGAAARPGLSLSESRFALDPASVNALLPQRWRLPLATGPVAGPHPYVLLEGSAQPGTRAALLVNAGQQGYARVQYDDALFADLLSLMAELQPVDQLGLLNDAWALGIAGYAPAQRVLQLARQLPAAANPIVWERVVSLLDTLDRHYQGAPQQPAWRRYAASLLAPLATRLGPTSVAGEPANAEIVRGELLELESRFGDAAVIASARARLAAGQGTAAELRTALAIVAAHADATAFDALLRQAQQTSDPLQKQRLYQALAGVGEPALASRMLDIALGDQVPAGSAAELIARLAANHPDLVWDTLAPRLDDPRLPLALDERWSLAQQVAQLSALPARVADVEAYERQVPAEARTPFLGTIAEIRSNQRVRSSVLPQLDRWISTQASAQPQ